MAGTPPFTMHDIRQFQPQAQEIIALAYLLDWNVRWQNQRQRAAVLSNGEFGSRKTITIPMSSINAHKARSNLTTVLQYTDSDQVFDLAMGKIDLTKQPEQVQRVLALLGTKLASMAIEHMEKRDPSLAAELPKEVAVQEISQSVGDAMKDAETAKAAKEAAEEGPTVVETGDYHVKRSSKPGDFYVSDVILTELMSDGSIRYRCKRCDYTAASPGSVRSHHNNAHPGQGTPQHKRITEANKILKQQGEKPVNGKSIIEMVHSAPTKTVTVSDKPESSHTATVAKEAAEAPLHGITLVIDEIKQALRKVPGSARDVAVHLRELDKDKRMEIATWILVGNQYDVLRMAAESRIDEANQQAEEWHRKYTELEAKIAPLRELFKMGDK